MSDYLFSLESHLNPLQNKAVNDLQKVATDANMCAWLTGGAMRDMLRGAPIHDLDFTVERDAIKTGKALVHVAGGEILGEDSLKRGIEVRLASGVRASVSNARTEKYSKPGGKPQIGPATIHEDLSRRDFTINAIALTLNKGAKGLLVDPMNGQADVRNRELRTTNYSSFFDDPSRLVRLLRFQTTLGFEIAPRTQSQFENAMLEGYGAGISGNAVGAELHSVYSDEQVVAFLEVLDKNGLLKPVAAGLTGAKLNVAGVGKLSKLAHTVLAPGMTNGWVAFVQVLLESASVKDRSEALKNLGLTAGELATLKKLDAGAKKLESTLKSARITKPSHVWDALEAQPLDDILMVLYRSGQRVVQDRIRAYYSKYLPQVQEVTEEMVLATGVKAGTPKYDKTWREMVRTKLNSRPKKVVVEEPPPPPPAPPIAMAAGRGRRPGAAPVVR